MKSAAGAPAFERGPRSVTMPPVEVAQQLAWMPTRTVSTSEAVAPINVHVTPAPPAQGHVRARP
jgi:hypothetical protein